MTTHFFPSSCETISRKTGFGWRAKSCLGHFGAEVGFVTGVEFGGELS